MLLGTVIQLKNRKPPQSFARVLFVRSRDGFLDAFREGRRRPWAVPRCHVDSHASAAGRRPRYHFHAAGDCHHRLLAASLHSCVDAHGRFGYVFIPNTTGTPVLDTENTTLTHVPRRLSLRFGTGKTSPRKKIFTPKSLLWLCTHIHHLAIVALTLWRL